MSKCPGLRVNFSSADVSNVAQEIAKNWLLKIVSIRGESKPQYRVTHLFNNKIFLA